VIDSDNGAEQQWFDEFGRASENPETLDRLVAVVNDRIVEGVPELRDPTLRPELEASTRAPPAAHDRRGAGRRSRPRYRLMEPPSGSPGLSV
jgi:hypothetical protein